MLAVSTAGDCGDLLSCQMRAFIRTYYSKNESLNFALANDEKHRAFIVVVVVARNMVVETSTCWCWMLLGLIYALPCLTFSVSISISLSEVFAQ